MGLRHGWEISPVAEAAEIWGYLVTAAQPSLSSLIRCLLGQILGPQIRVTFHLQQVPHSSREFWILNHFKFINITICTPHELCLTCSIWCCKCMKWNHLVGLVLADLLEAPSEHPCLQKGLQTTCLYLVLDLGREHVLTRPSMMKPGLYFFVICPPPPLRSSDYSQAMVTSLSSQLQVFGFFVHLGF